MLYDAGVSAWTNSSTKIFVRDPATDPAFKKLTAAAREAALVAAAYHEGVHIHQFVKAGKPPGTYAEMMEYEMDAYDETDTWLDKAVSLIPDKTIRDARAKQQQDMAEVLNLEIDKRRNDPPARREAAFKKFLMDNGMLPRQGHTQPADLY